MEKKKKKAGEIEGNQLIQLRNPPGKYNKNLKKRERRACASRIMESHCSYCCSDFGERCIAYYGKSL